jgi:hypothetical protein
LPGADRLAKRTGATIVANGEAIRVMRDAGVPDNQLLAVSGGERISLFTAAQRKKAIDNAPPPRPGPPQGPPGPPVPPLSEAVITVHAWPALHALLPPGDHRDFPETIDTGFVYTGDPTMGCTLDITRNLTYGLGGLIKLPQLHPQIPPQMRPFLEYMRDTDLNKYSYFDGGQIMFNFLLGSKTLLWSGHLGGYQGVFEHLEPQPDVAILAIAARANHNGRPFDGSAADYAEKLVKWIGMPPKVIWCLHDEGALNPKFIDTKAATERINSKTSSKVWELEHNKVYKVFGE